MDTIEVGDLNDLYRTADQLMGRVFKGATWFRGHANASWELVPTVHREYKVGFEKDMIVQFMTKARSRHPECPDHDDLAGWISLMRHYGLPTRLLDWTGSILVAAYFAVSYESGHTNGPAAIWALSPRELNMQRHPTAPDIVTLRDAKLILKAGFRGGPATDDAWAAMADEIDPRMMAQQSAFTIHGSPKPLETFPDHGRFLRKLLIPEEARKNLAWALHRTGIQKWSLFPDLVSLAEDIRERYLQMSKDGDSSNDQR